MDQAALFDRTEVHTMAAVLKIMQAEKLTIIDTQPILVDCSLAISKVIVEAWRSLEYHNLRFNGAYFEDFIPLAYKIIDTDYIKKSVIFMDMVYQPKIAALLIDMSFKSQNFEKIDRAKH